uniref:Uncharacterized protein n=1 Tax=Arundo donax TaxID=35708 RepID=A0A0A9HFD7_ARUDO
MPNSMQAGIRGVQRPATRKS